MARDSGWKGVSRLYRQEAPLSAVFQAIDEAACGREYAYSWASQEALLRNVLLPAASGGLSPSAAYTSLLLRKFTEASLASGAEEMSDGLFEFFSSLQGKEDIVSGYYSFDIFLPEPSSATSSGATLVLRVEPRQNDVGLRMWEAGYFLTEFLLANPSLVRNRHVIELGAGLGLTGMAAAAVCGAAHTSLTDCAQPVLDNLNAMVDLNGLKRASVMREQKQSTRREGDEETRVTIAMKDPTISVVEIDWLDGGVVARNKLGVNDSAQHGNELCIIAADVMYDPQYVPDLLNIIEALLKPQPGVAPPAAFVAATKRNESTLAIFFDDIKTRELSCIERKYSWPVDAPSPSPFYYNSASVLLFEIRYDQAAAGEAALLL